MFDAKEVAEIQYLLLRCSFLEDRQSIKLYQILKEVLTRVCWIALDEKTYSSFSLSEQLTFLYNQYQIPLALQKGIHQFRLTCFEVLNKEKKFVLTDEESLPKKDINVLTELFSWITDKDESKELKKVDSIIETFGLPSKIKRLRVIFHSKEANYLYVEPGAPACKNR